MSDELLDQVDIKDNVIGTVLKSKAHGDKSLIHREVAIAIFNHKQEVLLQRRSMNKTNSPGEWKITAAGHVGAGENPQDAITREVKEELGINVDSVYFKKEFEQYKNKESRFVYIYYAFVDSNPEIILDENEVMDAKWVKIADLPKFAENNEYTTTEGSHRLIMEMARSLGLVKNDFQNESYRIENRTYEIGFLGREDVPKLIEIAREWVRDGTTGEICEDELEEIRIRMKSSLADKEYRYFVVREENGDAIGFCGIREPEKSMLPFKSDPVCRSCELVNLFLTDKFRGRGLGYLLMLFTFDRARELGYQEMIWNSGPRYKNTSWDFYTKLVGKPAAVAKDFFGKGFDANVWRKELV